VVARLLALVKFSDPLIQFLVVLLGQLVNRFTLEFSAVDEQASFVSFKENTVAEINVVVFAFVVVVTSGL
jgi:hypothetical protein